VRAVRYYGRKDIRVETVKEPSAFAPNQVLVKPLWTGICGTDLHEITSPARSSRRQPPRFSRRRRCPDPRARFSAEV